MNYHRPLTEEVPKEIRLQVYKKALDMIGKWRYESNEHSQSYLIYPELCFLLPVILYKEKYFLNPSKKWSTKQTPTAFPEVSIEFLTQIQSTKTQSQKTLIRIDLLKSAIEQLENESVNPQKEQEQK